MNIVSKFTILVLAIVAVSAFTVDAQPLAFPGAEGGGMYTTGGRGGQVYFVTSLADTDTGNASTREGTLRWCLERSGTKTIVFKVGGTIELTDRINISDNTTIAGQTAPGDGICLKNYSIYVGGSNVIIRYIRSRMGDEKAYEGDAMWGRNEENIMIDHCSLSWSTDECGSFYDNKNFTLQWSILSESLRVSVHGKGSHGYGGIWGGKTATFHHNLLAHHDSRNPRMNGSRYSGETDLELVDFRNNVIYNWGGNSGYAGMGGSYNFVNNYYKAGPESSHDTRIFNPNPSTGKYEIPAGVWGVFYVNGNHVTASTAVTANNWLGIEPSGGDLPGGSINGIKSTTEFNVPKVFTHTADQAFQLVLDYGGASLKRDATDIRVMNEVKNGLAPDRASGDNNTKAGLIDSQTDVGGWDTYSYSAAEVPADTDRDGMPDEWEDQQGLDKTDASDRNTELADGTTMLEKYINGIIPNNPSTSISKPLDIISELKVFPNPCTSKLNVQLGLNEMDNVIINLFDISGRLMTTNNNNFKMGIHTVQFNLEGFKPGIYLLNVESSNSKRTQKIIVR